MLNVLLFHDVVTKGAPGKPADITYGIFMEILERAASCGVPVMSVREAWEKEQRGETVNGVALSFDDGWRSHHDVVLPELIKRKWRASFYLISSRLNHPEYVSVSQVRDMAAAGMDIGSHSHTHPYLTTLPRDKRMEEFSVSKRILEDALSCAVPSVAFPYGDYNTDVVSDALEAGYLWTCTSDDGANDSARQWKTGIRRFSVHAGMTADDAYRMLFPSWKDKIIFSVSGTVKNSMKKFLGRSQYVRLRKFIFGIRGGARKDGSADNP